MRSETRIGKEERTSKPVQRAGGVKVGREPGSNVDELANALDTGRLMEIPSGDRFSGSLVSQWARHATSVLTYLRTSKSVPAEMISIFWNFMISSSWTRTSRALRRSLGCKKCRMAQSSRNLCYWLASCVAE